MNTRWHVPILIAVTALLTLPRLGTPSLWDMDEGVNAECSREMMETGTWVVPTFNYELRTAKPVMLYWLQRASYNVFGVDEFAARLPSAILSIGTVLLVYVLGRRLFDATTGLLAGIVLASSLEFVKLAHAATPDATFLFFTTLALTLYALLKEGGRWPVLVAAACALAVLTKGPAGVALPGLVIVIDLVLSRRAQKQVPSSMLHVPSLIRAAGVFILVAAPWYGFVAAETRGAYIRAFFGNENVGRFLQPMENHRGPVVYYIAALLVFFAPWSVVLGATLVRAWRERATPAVRLLFTWFAVYLVFFSLAATKLPNYIAPLYPPVALLTAHTLIAWMRQLITSPRWVERLAVGGLIIMAAVVAVGMLVMGGAVELPLKGVRVVAGLAPWAGLALVPLVGAMVIVHALKHANRPRAVAALAVVAVGFAGLLAAFPIAILDEAKAPKRLVAESGARQPERDIRLASLDYTQESVTFYAERRVERLKSVEAAAEFLASPRPGYLFVPRSVWQSQVQSHAGPHRIAACRYDFYRNAEILVVTNEGATP